MLKKQATVVVFLLVGAVFIVLLTPKILHVTQLNKRSNELERDLKKLRYQNRLLERELKALQDDPVYLEKVAREELNKAKQGEIVYKLVRETPKDPVVR